MGAARRVEPPAGERPAPLLAGVSASERFGLRGMPPARGADDAPGGGGAGLAWELPEGWAEVAPTSMRQANFLAGGDPRAECYLTLLPGDAGGLAANVNRWRKQMALAPLSAAEVEALPRAELFGGPATLLDLEGTFTGMGGSGAADGYRMLGLLRIDAGGSRFFKLTGPAETVVAERDAFLALAASFREDDGTLAADDPHAGHDHGPGEGHHEDHGEDAAGDGLFVPDGWRRGPDKPFRAVSFFVDEGEEAECYVTVLNGDGGGVRANVDRWRDQLGHESATDRELAELERIPMFGREALLVELTASDGSSAMLAAACFLDESSLFVRMTGPTAVVERERASFLEFCTLLGGPQ